MVKNSIYYYDLSDSSIEIGYTSDSPTIPTVEGVSVEASKSLTYKIKINGASGKTIKIGSSIGLNNSNLTLPSGTIAFSLLSDPTGAETLVAKANSEDLDYNTATDNQKNQMWTFSHEETEQLGATTDYRYIGANPNNYVKFNDELWRIIGVFDVDDGTGKIEKRLKIVRAEPIGGYSLDNKNTSTGADSSYGTSDWPNARLTYLLNEGHEAEANGGSLYWNRKSGTCYSGSNNATVSCDFSSIGLTDDAKSFMAAAKWYLGGSSTYDDITTLILYARERGNIVYNGRVTSWTGKVGLIYPSDYGYATSGGTSTERTTCLTSDIYNWGWPSDCSHNDWLVSGSIYWSISPLTSDSYNGFRMGYTGGVSYAYAYFNSNVWPTVYLKSTINITSGTGSSTDPFILAE